MFYLRVNDYLCQNYDLHHVFKFDKALYVDKVLNDVKMFYNHLKQ